ncbi:hypothetical protein D9M71_359810 [compost metagenome]
MFEAGTWRRANRGRVLRALEVLFFVVVTGSLDQFLAIKGQDFFEVAVKVDFPLILACGQQLAVASLEAVAVGCLFSGGIDLPFEIRPVGQQGLAQIDAFGCGIDGVLVDPCAVEILSGMAGAAAHECGQQRKGERVAHGWRVLPGDEEAAKREWLRRGSVTR